MTASAENAALSNTDFRPRPTPPPHTGVPLDQNEGEPAGAVIRRAFGERDSWASVYARAREPVSCPGDGLATGDACPADEDRAVVARESAEAVIALAGRRLGHEPNS